MNSIVVQTSLGRIGIEFSSRGLTRLRLRPARARSGDRTESAPAWLPRLTRDLRRYADGRVVAWNIPIDLSGGTLFQRRVWQAMRQIPRGQTRSYAWVAGKIGRPHACRAVGAACGANPIPIIVPCHRVVASDGSLGGYTGGLVRKKQLLRMERAPFTGTASPAGR